jgi:hypothetical protein
MEDSIMNDLSSVKSLMSNGSNSTSSDLPEWSGYLFILGSSFFWGSNFVPVKQFETGDGMFFQLILCVAIWSSGFIVNAARGFPKFYPLPVVGGIFWTVKTKLIEQIIF